MIVVLSVSSVNSVPFATDELIESSLLSSYVNVTVIPAFVYVPVALAGVVFNVYPAICAACAVYALPTVPVSVVDALISFPVVSTYLTVTVPCS